jgi:Integrase core domain
MAGAETSGTAVAMEGQVVAQGDRLRAAAATAAALARRYFLYQPVRHVLLLVQCAGWMQPISRALGFAGGQAGIISDNGPQFIARDFKEFIRISGMTHVRTSPFYPQSNGKIERWHKSLKRECIRPLTPLTLEDARRLIQTYVDHYNTVRLHSALGYVTPQDMLAGRQAEIHAARDRKLEQARRQRQLRRQQTPSLRYAPSSRTATMASPGETEAGTAGMQPC